MVGMNEDHERETFAHDPIDHVRVTGDMTVGELATAYGNGGIGADNLHEAVRLTACMFDPDVTLLMGLAGAMVPAGMRAIVTHPDLRDLPFVLETPNEGEKDYASNIERAKELRNS